MIRIQVNCRQLQRKVSSGHREIDWLCSRTQKFVEFTDQSIWVLGRSFISEKILANSNDEAVHGVFKRDRTDKSE